MRRRGPSMRPQPPVLRDTVRTALIGGVLMLLLITAGPYWAVLCGAALWCWSATT